MLKYFAKFGFKKTDCFLLCIIAILIITIIAGTFAGLSKKKNQTPQILLQTGKARNLNEPVNSDLVAYYEIGKIRVITEPDASGKKSDKNGTPMVISPWLAYPQEDSVFFEELARKRGVIRGIFSDYFSTHTKNQLLSETETKSVENLIERINSQLSLGKISDIYFTDYLFLDY